KKRNLDNMNGISDSESMSGTDETDLVAEPKNTRRDGGTTIALNCKNCTGFFVTLKKRKGFFRFISEDSSLNHGNLVGQSQTFCMGVFNPHVAHMKIVFPDYLREDNFKNKKDSVLHYAEDNGIFLNKFKAERVAYQPSK